MHQMMYLVRKIIAGNILLLNDKKNCGRCLLDKAVDGRPAHTAHFFHDVIVAGQEVEALADRAGGDGGTRHVQQQLYTAARDPVEDELLVAEEGHQEAEGLEPQAGVAGLAHADQGAKEARDVLLEDKT